MWPSGYTMLVRGGDTLSITLGAPPAVHADLFTLEYSFLQRPRSAVTLSVSGDMMLAGGPCVVSSNHSRDLITPYGPLLAASGAWWECKGGWPTAYGAEDLVDGFAAKVEQHQPPSCGDATVCDELYQPPGGGDVVYDPSCRTSSIVGCSTAGRLCCRLCDADGYAPCSGLTGIQVRAPS